MLSEEQKASMKQDIIILQNIANDFSYSDADRSSALHQAHDMIAIIYNYFPDKRNKENNDDSIVRK